MMADHPETMKAIFGTKFDILVEALDSDKEELMAFARSIQHPLKQFVFEPWKGMFKSLGRREEFQNLQVKYATGLFRSAVELCSEYGLWSERAVALMFDIKVQNGSISKLVKAQVLSETEGLPEELPEEQREVQKMRIVANRRAEAANPKWIEDVRARKLCCAGGGGRVHGTDYHVEEQFGIRLARFSLEHE
jgi:hypothetical protein